MRRSFLLMVAGCAPGTATIEVADTDDTAPDTLLEPTRPPTDVPSDTSTPPSEAADYRALGPHAVVTSELEVQTSCDMAVTTWRPDGVQPASLVILAHGFARSSAQMAGWAEHWASWGLAVATPDLCHTSLFDTDHEQNAADLQNLAGVLGGGKPVVYAGHSAGALAALLAASEDPDALAFLGLDLTDADDLALDAAAGFPVQGWALLGEPEVCNASGNGAAVFGTAPSIVAVRIVGADHCDFESPTDWACTTFCSDGAAVDDTVRDAILGLSTGALLGVTGLDAAGLSWWTPGSCWWDPMVAAGAIVPL